MSNIVAIFVRNTIYCVFMSFLSHSGGSTYDRLCLRTDKKQKFFRFSAMVLQNPEKCYIIEKVA